MRYLITFSYDGSKYKGYQKQPKAKTVQNALEKALKTINNDKTVDVYASGRTDAGVHALNQKAHFDLKINITCDKLNQALNSLLPKDIYVKEVEEVNDKFHARFDAKAKEYIYMINMGEYNPIKKDYVYQYNKRLDVVEMERALKYLEGTHDFTSFSKPDEEKENFTRTIIQANLIRDMKNINEFTISFLGNGFLRYQVRIMVGLLIEVGEGKRESREIIDVLAVKDRRKSGPTVPPEGLYLKDVFYR